MVQQSNDFIQWRNVQWSMIVVHDFSIIIANLPLNHFGMNSPNRSAYDLMNTIMNSKL